MNCQQARIRITDLLDVPEGKPWMKELERHIEDCPNCSRELNALRETLHAITPKHRVSVSPHFKERVMNALSVPHQDSMIAWKKERKWAIGGRPAWVAGFAALILLALSVLIRPQSPNTHSPAPGFALLQQAFAEEADLFSGQGIVHLVNEIEVDPVSDETLAANRWFPTCSLKADGKLRFDQLRLPAQPGQGYTVKDETWYDRTTGQFSRVLQAEGKPIFANAFDGERVYTLETKSEGSSPVAQESITGEFKRPEKPSDFLGIAAGLPSGISEEGPSLVQESGEGVLEDGTPVRIFKAGIGDIDSYCRFKVRKDDNSIAEIEWLAADQLLLSVRRLSSEVVEKPGVSWNLAEINERAGATSESPRPEVMPNMVISNVSVQHMVEKAEFETYIFAPMPKWTSTREIVDILDLPSPPKRMFCIAYRANDGRHVVLVQSSSFNAMLGSIAKGGTQKYQSPNGFKVLSGPKDKWMAQITLQSARASIKDAPSENRTGYTLESPVGTFPVLAINGELTDDELHGLIDSLVPARDSRE